MRIIIFKNNNGPKVYNASTQEDLEKACLHVLKERFGRKFYSEPIAPIELSFTSNHLRKLTPQFESLKEEAKAKIADYKEDLRQYEMQKEIYDEIVKAIQENDGAIAFDILKARKHKEGEGFDIVHIEEL